MRQQVMIMSALLSMPFTAHASWFDDPFGLVEAARVAGAQAGADTAQAMIKASRNLPMMTNQFGQILSDYYGDDEKNKANARRLIEGAFKVNLEQTGKFDVEVTAAFENTYPTKPIRADILFLDDENDSEIQAILKSSTRFKGEQINAPTLTSTTKDQARAQIRTLIEKRENNTTGCPKPKMMWGGRDGGGRVQFAINQDAIDKCVKNNETSAFADAILTPVEFTKTIPSKKSFTRQYTGGKYAILVIPTDDLQSAPNDLSIDIIMHQQGDTTKTLSIFKESPKKIDLSYMKQHIAKTDNATYGAFNYSFIDLRIEAFSAVPISPE